MGQIIVDEAAEAGVRRFIFSTGPNSRELVKGKTTINAGQSKLETSAPAPPKPAIQY
jgi:UTP-glucose-1-phosphate uridylyltransferase